ncbi:IucA/IucC family siderophore biosynthesis protein [Streptomyces sp. SID3343]|nr:IucA/IucC family protein [Streptomyces sp. SID3343]MYW05891.1 IucA/IucC family siderophore biosynthesis protein [Streptomyces sp. SID3343]
MPSSTDLPVRADTLARIDVAPPTDGSDPALPSTLDPATGPVDPVDASVDLLDAPVDSLDAPADREVLRRVLDTVLREDVLALRSTAELVRRPDGPWLRLTRPPHAGAWLLPVRADGFQCEYAARLPLLEAEADGARRTDTAGVLAALRDLADPQDRSGFDDFAHECRQAVAVARLHESAGPSVRAALADRHGPDPSAWTGLRASPALDTLAAYLQHPVYPTAHARSGLDAAALRAHAPEFHAAFQLRWAVVAREALTLAGALPAWWPDPAALGLPRLAASHLALPVHPLTFDRLPDPAIRVERPYLDVLPTLSMRTVASTADPSVHLKLPLPTASLGLLNRRTVRPGSLVDGAAGQRLLAAVLDREPRFRDRVLLADEQSYLHAGHELLAVMVRRYPPVPEGALVLPLAALLARGPDGALVLDRVAQRFHGGDRFALIDAYLSLLLDWQTTLYRYGIALESHPQNVSLVLTEGRPPRLLFKDNDGPRVNSARCPLPHDDFADPRTLTTHDGPLADVFVTITVHLCAGAVAFALPPAERERVLDLVRDRVAATADPDLRRRVLAATRLPVKAMVTAGTLLSKQRSGAADINKHYVTGPNYLRRPTATR